MSKLKRGDRQIVSFHHIYFNEGYKVEHHMHRHNDGKIHTFIIHDHGVEELPSPIDILNTYAMDEKKYPIISHSSKILDPHHIEHVWKLGRSTKQTHKEENS